MSDKYIAVFMGSDSDLPVMELALEPLQMPFSGDGK